MGELAASSAEESSVAGGILSLWPLKGEGKWLQQVQGILKTGNRKEVRMEEAVAQGRCLFLAPKGTLSRMISICDFPDLSCFGNQCVTEGGPVAAKFQVSEFVQRHQEKGLPSAGELLAVGFLSIYLQAYGGRNRGAYTTVSTPSV